MPGKARKQKCKAFEIVVGMTNVFHSSAACPAETAAEEIPLYVDRLTSGETLISKDGYSFACDVKSQFKEELLYLRRDSGLQAMADRARKTSLSISAPGETRIGWHTSISRANCPEGLNKDLVDELKHTFPKADVIVVGKKDGAISRRIGISVKETGAHPKLGQLSGETTFYLRPNPITIKGGLSKEVRSKVELAIKDVPEPIKAKILESKPNIRKEHKDFFIYKNHAPEDWKRLVEAENSRARESFDKLFEGFKDPLNCAHNVMTFLRRTLIGTDSTREDCEYYISAEAGLINLKLILEDEKVLRSIEQVHVAISTSKGGKSSTIIYVKLQGFWYLLVKFEASFDGAKPKPSQIKGVIYYFQWPAKKFFRNQNTNAPFASGQTAYRTWTEFLEAAWQIAKP